MKHTWSRTWHAHDGSGCPCPGKTVQVLRANGSLDVVHDANHELIIPPPGFPVWGDLWTWNEWNAHPQLIVHYRYLLSALPDEEEEELWE